MYEPIRILGPSEEERFRRGYGFDVLSSDALTRHAADAHWMLADVAGGVSARCSLWWTATPPYADHRLGLIGHYAARDSDAAAQLLQLACDELAAHGSTLAVGPMDGNTWQRYRCLPSAVRSRSFSWSRTTPTIGPAISPTTVSRH